MQTNALWQKDQCLGMREAGNEMKNDGWEGLQSREFCGGGVCGIYLLFDFGDVFMAVYIKTYRIVHFICNLW